MTQPNRQSANFFPFVFFLLEKGRKVFSSSASYSGSADNFQIVPFTLFSLSLHLLLCSTTLTKKTFELSAILSSQCASVARTLMKYYFLVRWRLRNQFPILQSVCNRCHFHRACMIYRWMNQDIPIDLIQNRAV